MAEVVAIHGAAVAGHGKPSEAACTLIDDIHERVHAGDIVGFVAIPVHADGSVSHYIAGFCACYAAVGGIEVAKAAILEEIQTVSGDG